MTRQTINAGGERLAWHEHGDSSKAVVLLHGIPTGPHLWRRVIPLLSNAGADRLPTLDLPARIEWGAADRFQKLEYGKRLARDPRAPLTSLENARHFVPDDHPEPVADTIDQVLATAAER
ncbi:MAG: hypothetical protein M3517_01055 [Actinomycetota bacterium]|nr:hypothetical protein [Actinomycetota bacterium]